MLDPLFMFIVFLVLVVTPIILFAKMSDSLDIGAFIILTICGIIAFPILNSTLSNVLDVYSNQSNGGFFPPKQTHIECVKEGVTQCDPELEVCFNTTTREGPYWNETVRIYYWKYVEGCREV